MLDLVIKIGSLQLFAETTAENPETVKRVLEQLPVEATAQRWGQEIYFLTGFGIAQEHGRQECEPGEVGFWVDGPGIAVFFGKTPVSTSDKPRAYSPCNFFARLSGKLDKQALNAVKDGEKIWLGKAKQARTYT